MLVRIIILSFLVINIQEADSYCVMPNKYETLTKL